MTNYKTIHGKKVKYLSSDPPAEVGEGQVWYNSSAANFKAAVTVEAWSSGAAHPTANRHGFASGTQTASLKMGGNMPSGANRGEVEEYNGTSWAEQSDLPTGTQTNTGIGIQTAALSVSGGADTDITLEYDGSSWTSGGDLGSARVRGFGSGTQTAGMFSGGSLGTSPYFVQTAVEQYDGSSWSSNPASLNAGQAGYTSNNVGTSSRDTTIVAGGHAGSPPSNTGVTQIYDGSTWRTAPSMATARQTSLTGDSSAALVVGGGSNTTAVEEFSASKAVKVITDS